MKISSFTIIILLLTSCGESHYEKPDFYFQGEFSPTLVNRLDIYIKDLAEAQGFRVYEKKRSQMKVLTNGKDAFYISFYKENDDVPVLFITNVGAGTELTLGLYSTESFSLNSAKKLSELIINYLKKEMDIELKPVDPLSL